MLGTAKVMGYDDPEKAKAERAAKETAKEAEKFADEVIRGSCHRQEYTWLEGHMFGSSECIRANGANDMRLQYGGCRTRSVCWHAIKQ